jgi:flagellar protein FliS
MGIESYKKINVETSIEDATPLRIIQMLYQGAISKCFEAKGAIERKQYIFKSELISGVIAIVMELERSLDPTHAPELSSNLASLYNYIRETALEANMENNAQKMEEIANLLLTLKEGWDNIKDPDEKN